MQFNQCILMNIMILKRDLTIIIYCLVLAVATDLSVCNDEQDL